MVCGYLKVYFDSRIPEYVIATFKDVCHIQHLVGIYWLKRLAKYIWFLTSILVLGLFRQLSVGICKARLDLA